MNSDSLTTMIPLNTYRWGARRQVVDAGRCVHNASLLKSLALAYYWLYLLETGVMRSHSDIARAEQLDLSVVTRTLHLTQVSPAIVEACLEGKQPRCWSVRWLGRQRIPLLWLEQDAWIDHARANGT